MWYVGLLVRALPWVPYGIAGGLVLGVVVFVAQRQRGFTIRRPVALAGLVTWLSWVLVITLSPAQGVLQSGGVPGSCGWWEFGYSDVGGLVGGGQAVLNSVLFIPIGVLAIVSPGRRMAVVCLGVGMLLPPMIEAVQWAVTALGRSGCSLSDVVQNWLGVIVGLLVGVMARRVLRTDYPEVSPPPV